MDLLVGTILLFPYGFAPQGFMQCTGQLLPIRDHQALFAAIGAQFGGDGVTYFALPDYRADAPKGSTYCIAMQGRFPHRPDSHDSDAQQSVAG